MGDLLKIFLDTTDRKSYTVDLTQRCNMEIKTIIQELRLAHYELKDEKVITEGAIRAREHTMEVLNNLMNDRLS